LGGDVLDKAGRILKSNLALNRDTYCTVHALSHVRAYDPANLSTENNSAPAISLEPSSIGSALALCIIPE
jgi:hypothetical protein